MNSELKTSKKKIMADISNSKPSVLIICTGNSCRSHMAEGLLRAAAGR